MRFIFIVVNMLFFGAGVANAAPVFLTTAPRTWKLLDKVDDSHQVYFNTRSTQNERIILQSADVISESSDFQSRLDEKRTELNQVRANFFSKMGMSGYTILKIENRKSKLPLVKFYQVIESRFRNLNYTEVQMVERQYLYKSKLYTIAYTAESRAFGNRSHIEDSLDYFLPVLNDSRRPASDRGDGSMSTAIGEISAGYAHLAESGFFDSLSYKEAISDSHLICEAATERSPAGDQNPAKFKESAKANSISTTVAKESDTALPISPIADLDMASSSSKAVCSGIPEDKRRKPFETGFVNAFSGTLSDGWGCLKGVKDNLWGMITSTATLAWDAGKYVFSSSYRDQTNSTAGVIYSEIKKSPKEFAKRVGSEIWNIAAKSVGDFKCMNTQEQVREICNLATNFLPGGILLKVVTKVPLAVADATKVTAMVKNAMGLDKAGLGTVDAAKSVDAIAAAKVIEPGAVANLVDNKGPVTTKVVSALKPAEIESVKDASVHSSVGLTPAETARVSILRSAKPTYQKELVKILERIDQTQADRLDRALRVGGKAAEADIEKIIAKGQSENFARSLSEHEFTGNAKADTAWLQKVMHDLAKSDREAVVAPPLVAGANAAHPIGANAAAESKKAVGTEGLSTVATDDKHDPGFVPQVETSESAETAKNEDRDRKMLQQITSNPKKYQQIRSMILTDPNLSVAERAAQLKVADAAKSRLDKIWSDYGNILKAKKVSPTDGKVVTLIADLEKQGISRETIREALIKIDPNHCGIPH